jgi:hypothetical protein
VHHLVPVVSSRELAEELLNARLFAVAGANRYEDWLGYQPFALWNDRGQREFVRAINVALTERDPRYHVERALRPIVDRPGDVGAGLREAALTWMLDAICQTDQQHMRAAHAVARTWQRAAETIPLLLPSLRGWSRRFTELAPAKLRLLTALCDGAAGNKLDSIHGSVLASGYLTLLGPVVDALPMVAMSALTFRGQLDAVRIEKAMATAHPMPLLLLEAKKYVHRLPLSGLTLDRPNADTIDFCPGGGHVAIDLAGARLPWGVGPFAPVFRAIVEKFAHAVLGVAADLDLTAVEAVRRGRVRMCFGATRLRMAKWPG